MTEKTTFKAALTKALALCSRVEYCSEDIRKKLKMYGLSTDDEERIISQLVSEKFIDDERYSKAFVRDKFRYNKWGKLKITAHLRAKKISDEAAAAALGEIDSEDYINLIRNLLISHKKTLKAKNKYEMKAKLLRFGLSRGFESNILYEILNEEE